MTYNFDPDEWFVNELRVLEGEFQKGTINRRQYEDLVEALDQKHTEMWCRLDGSYRIA